MCIRVCLIVAVQIVGIVLCARFVCNEDDNDAVDESCDDDDDDGSSGGFEVTTLKRPTGTSTPGLLICLRGLWH